MNRDSEHLACRFDAYCKRLLKNEVIDAIRGEKRMGQREVAFSDLTRAERGQLQYIDQYAPDRRVFPLMGMEIEVLDADLVRALSTLPTDRRAIILLSYFLEMQDEEIGDRLGLSRPAVQRRRTSTLDMLRKILKE